MPKKPALKTPAQVRSDFERRGESVAAWARKHQFGQSLVYAVINGHKKCLRGQSHKVAVLLGLKAGEIVND